MTRGTRRFPPAASFITLWSMIGFIINSFAVAIAADADDEGESFDENELEEGGEAGRILVLLLEVVVAVVMVVGFFGDSMAV